MDRIVITISRGYGSGGRYIGKLLAKELGRQFYDRELISLVADEDEDPYIENDETVNFSLSQIEDGDFGFISDDKMYLSQSKIIMEIAQKESCVIVGRCADYVLKNLDNVVNVFIHASEKSCMKRVMRLYELNPDEAKQMIASKNKSRSEYYQHYTGRMWNDANNYDISINSGVLDSKKCVEVIKEYLKIRFE